MNFDIKNVPLPEAQRYLRVATIANKTALSYFYIGNDENSLKYLSESFHSGYQAESFEQAKSLIRSNLRIIDVFILDIEYNHNQVAEFIAFLKNRGLRAIPVIYNDCHFAHQDSARPNQYIDDVVDLCSYQYDFSSKVSFLRKSKEYSFRGQDNPCVEPPKSVSKRIFDIVVSSILILLLLPVFILIALAVKLESKGPIFYNAKRAGRGFRIFKFFKFRTMEVNADKKIDSLAHLNQYGGGGDARFFKISNDPRITRVGKFLRNSSLDELPQLFNVLKGDMSLVGNRPLPLYEAATLTTNEYVERFMAPAGITGLWQIKKRGKADMSTEERINLDISYARKFSLKYDLWIMALTPKALMQKTDV